MKIPIPETTISPEIPNVRATQVPGAVSGAFGEREAEALQGFGQDVSKVGGQVDQLYKQQAQVKITNLENQFMEKSRGLLYNPDPNATETIKGPNGEDVTVSSSLLGRYDYNAKGATDEYVNRVSKIYDDILSQSPGGVFKAELANRMNQTRLSHQENVIQHEVTQVRQGNLRQYSAKIANQIAEASNSPTQPIVSADGVSMPKLARVLDNITSANQDAGIYAGKSQDEITKQTEEDKAKAIISAGHSMLEDRLTLDQVNAVLGSKDIMDRTPKTKQEDIDFALEIRAQRIAGMAKTAQLHQKVQYTTDTLSQLASGKLDLTASNLLPSISQQNPDLGRALNLVLTKQFQGKEYKGADRDFASYINKIYAAPATQEDINNTLVKSLQEHPTISNDHLAIIVNAAMDRMKNLPLSKGTNDGKTDPQQQEIESHVKSLQQWGKDKPDQGGNGILNFFKGLLGGKPPQVAHDDAVKSAAITQHPWITTIPKEGAIYRDKVTNAKRRVFPDGSTQEVQ
jgi:hypothetical protein